MSLFSFVLQIGSVAKAFKGRLFVTAWVGFALTHESGPSSTVLALYESGSAQLYSTFQNSFIA